MGAVNTGKPVLIIDDDMQMRFYLMTMVKSLGMEPVTARDGDEGLDILRTLHPALIILDIMMPKKGGTIVYKRITAHKTLKKIPLVFFSAVDRGAFMHYIRMLNNQDQVQIPEPEYYVAKNADPAYLRSVLVRCLNESGT